jgi:hypothetical protein
MNEKNGLIYCSACGAQNPDTFKFCSSCGAKLEQPKQPEPVSEQPEASAEQPAFFEKPEAEIVSEGSVPLTQDDISSAGAFSEEEELYINYDRAETPVSSVSGKTTKGNSGYAIASMVCGIISLVCCCMSWFSMILAIAAIVLGIIVLKNKYDNKGMAIAGIVTGGIALFIWLIILILGGTGVFAALAETITDAAYLYN